VGQKDPEDDTLMLARCPNLQCYDVTLTLSLTLMIQDYLGQDSDNINENTSLDWKQVLATSETEFI
jgi:hypothetical protein